MTTRRTRQLLWTATILAVGAGLAVLAAGVTLPIDDVAGNAPPAAIAPAKTGDELPALSEWDAVWTRDFGHALTPIAPAPVEDSTPVAATVDLHVWGTVIEPGRSMAIIAGPEGKALFLKIGDEAQGAKIVSIATDSVTFDVGGKSLVLSVEKPPLPPKSPELKLEDQ